MLVAFGNNLCVAELSMYEIMLLESHLILGGHKKITEFYCKRGMEPPFLEKY